MEPYASGLSVEGVARGGRLVGRLLGTRALDEEVINNRKMRRVSNEEGSGSGGGQSGNESAVRCPGLFIRIAQNGKMVAALACVP